MTNNLWKSGTQKAYYGYVAQLIIGLVGGLVTSLATLGSAAASLASGEIPTGSNIIGIIIALISVAALVYYLLGINEMKQSAAETKLAVATNRLFIGACLAILGSVLGVIPVIGLVGSLVALAGFIVTWTGYAQIKDNATDENAKLGGTKLSTSALLSVIAAVVAIIPIIGWIATLVLEIIALVYAINGWKSLACSELA